MFRLLFASALTIASCVSARGDDVTYKSDVALARVDTQVVDRDGRAIVGLQVNDFVLRVDGRIVPIRNFASENMPIDILLLLDVSGSMQPHVERIASAAQQALNVLDAKDRVAIMVFDTNTRVRLPFRSGHREITGELNRLLRSERFDGGTYITHAMLEAAKYVQREARPDARRAIVILTDDETQDREDEAQVGAALARANAVLSFLQAPYEPPTVNGSGGGVPHGTWGSGGGSWPGGGGIGFPGGGPVILGRGGPAGLGGDDSHSAGTAVIANDSGGDTMRVAEASALEDTLARLRQRYSLNFYFPEGLSDRGPVRVDLGEQASIRYANAEIRSRRVFISGSHSGEGSGPTAVTRAHDSGAAGSVDGRASSETSGADPVTTRRRSAPVNEDSGPRVNTIETDSESGGEQSHPPTMPTAPPKQTPVGSGWPRTNQQFQIQRLTK